MTVLRYSRGRGRGPSGPSNYSNRGRGGRSGAARFRSMTWTNPTVRHGCGQKKLNLPEAVPGGQTPKTRVNQVCARTSKAGNLVWVNSSTGGHKSPSSTANLSCSAHSSGQTRPCVEGYSQRKPPGQIARYSGPRGGRGELPGGRGTVAWRGGRGGGRGYWTPCPSRGLAGLRGGMSRSNHSRGRGMRRFLHPSAMLRMRYTASLQSALRFGHPASRWISRRSPWAFVGRWRNPIASSRTRMPPMAKPHFKNLSFIRGVILQRPVKTASRSTSPQTVAAAAAARRVAIARRFIYSTRMPSPKRQVGTPTSSGFVHSGGYGMAIRRVSGSHPAASGAAAASPAKKSETALSVSAAGGNQVGKLKASTLENVSTASSKVSKSSRVSSETHRLPVGKAALLSQSRMRTVKSVKASSAVAGARAKKTQVLVRNMTLYRKKGEVVVTAQGHAGNKVKAKTEPCLFFCKFGKCLKSDDECRYVHDKTKVAVCRGFLKGTCRDGDKCPLTHAVQAEKMPVCVFFEKGMCFTPNCPYRHVKVSENAAICPHFLKGHCPDGTSCKLKHKYPERKKEDGAESGDHLGGDGTADDKEGKDSGIETGRGTSRCALPGGDSGEQYVFYLINASSRHSLSSRKLGSAAGVASAATSASVSLSKGKSGESVGLHGSGAGVGVGETRAEAGGGTEGGSVKEWKTIEGDDEYEYEEDELKPRFLWRRRKKS